MLKPHYGDMIITTPGATYDALDIHGFVTIKAPNVTIKRSLIRGGVARAFGGVVNSDAAAANFVLLDSEVVPEHPSVYLDGVIGWNYTLTRVNIHGSVDAAKVFGSNVTIQYSWLHDTVHYASDPSQGGGPSHNDGVQVLGGDNIRIVNTTITGSDNSAMQVTQGDGPVSGLSFSGNWVDGGGCSVNMTNGSASSMRGVTLQGNRFGHATRVRDCAVLVTGAIQLSATANVFDDTNLPVRIRYV